MEEKSDTNSGSWRDRSCIFTMDWNMIGASRIFKLDSGSARYLSLSLKLTSKNI